VLHSLTGIRLVRGLSEVNLKGHMFVAHWYVLWYWYSEK